ncbi:MULTISPECIES: PH domain-containing protein [Leuconostoc]|uniref:YdbS-like PH domain-containing protein n=2 Tax=Leuconostoc carnosum TaxID=1252 RepID=K0DBU7_LEUCJ|nr:MULTISPECIES: PH domain-containing protein [Leuconostoc]AFT81431.1 hypothetical protein C270_02590 [Leuconostoc carnosum JB16]KAA8326035.1 hypothetical protein FE404_02565 [Leuconostoc carnosum]KAA8330242.1 hypothetical protein FE409_02600 [Leuconostoc carnosum]KAA8367981.1 hypothetical protein FE416_02690 [Leuconostoc carnosum]KAA8370606.1 hypothetical protein FE414_02630 [Leuconostoc carnosum]
MTKEIGHRQPKVAIIREVLNVFVSLIWPAFFGILRFSGSRVFQLGIVVILLLVSLAFGFLKWYFFTYITTEHEISLKRGIFAKKHVHLPFERIQTITRNQPIYFQPFDVFHVTIETSGKSQDKIEFSALTLPQIEHIENLRRRSQTKSAEVIKTLSEQPAIAASYQINDRDLCLFALTSLGSLGTVGAIFLIFSQVQEFLPATLSRQFTAWLNQQNVTIFIGLVMIFIIFGFLLSFFKLYSQYFQFKISRIGQHLAITRGLFTKQNVQLRVSRVQAVHFQQSLLRRLVKLVSVDVLLASSVNNTKGEVKQTSIMPVVRMSSAGEVIQPFLPQYHFINPTNSMNANRALWYRLNMIFWLDIFIASLIWITYYITKWTIHFHLTYDLPLLIICTILLIGYSLLASWWQMMDQRIQVDGQYLIVQLSSNFTKHTYYMPREKIQSIATSRSMLLINKHITHLHITVRDGDSARRLTLRYLQEPLVKKINSWIVDVK